MRFSGSGHQVSGDQPLMQRNVRALHNGASAHGPLFTAIVVQDHTGLRFTTYAANANRTTTRASGLAIPTRRFDMSDGFGFVAEDGVGDVLSYADCMASSQC